MKNTFILLCIFLSIFIFISASSIVFSQKIIKVNYPADIYQKVLNGEFEIDAIEVKNAGHFVNSTGEDYSPYLTIDGRMLIYTSNRNGSILNDKGNPSHDFWVAVKQNPYDQNFVNKFHIPKGINSDRNEGAFTYNFKGDELYFTLCGTDNGYGSCDIFKMKIYKDSLGPLENLGKGINTSEWESLPSLDPYSEKIYFASGFLMSDVKKEQLTKNLEKRTTTYDQKRLINVSEWNKDKEKWSDSKSIRDIYTNGVNTTPFICSDGKTLIFASDSHEPNYGGLDLYVTQYDAKENSWKEPLNLGTKINTSYDEFSSFLAHNSYVFYYTSGRQDLLNYGSDDIFYALIPNSTENSLEAIAFVEPYTFADKAGIEFELEQAGAVEINIKDVYGRHVRKLWSGNKEAGLHTLEWDGKKDTGEFTVAGPYDLELKYTTTEPVTELHRLYFVR